jgi:hypothetical protein
VIEPEKIPRARDFVPVLGPVTEAAAEETREEHDEDEVDEGLEPVAAPAGEVEHARDAREVRQGNENPVSLYGVSEEIEENGVQAARALRSGATSGSSSTSRGRPRPRCPRRWWSRPG